MKTNIRGAIPAIYLIVAGVAACTQLVPNWRIGNLFKREPKAPIAELQAAQATVARLKAEADAVTKELNEKHAAELDAFKKQFRGIQQLHVGQDSVLNKIPKEQRSKEVKVAVAMGNRISLRFVSAIGKLPQDQQDEILMIMDEALSDAQAQVDEAERKLKIKDAEATVLAVEKKQLQESIAVLEPKLTGLLVDKAKAEDTVKVKTDEVVVVTQLLQTEKREKGSFATMFNDLWFKVKWGVIILVALYVFLVFIVPGVIKHMGAGLPKTILRNVSGYLSNPLLFHDAKVKIADLAKKVTTDIS